MKWKNFTASVLNHSVDLEQMFVCPWTKFIAFLLYLFDERRNSNFFGGHYPGKDTAINNLKPTVRYCVCGVFLQNIQHESTLSSNPISCLKISLENWISFSFLSNFSSLQEGIVFICRWQSMSITQISTASC